jgi:hypothetical protein
MRYTTSQQFTAHFNRKPRIARNDSELKKLYQRYLRMGFDEREARFKANLHHGMKL